MILTANRIAGTLRRHGYKLTPQRHAILKAIAASYHHQTPATICQRAQTLNPSVSLVTVYRTLDILTELKLVCEVHRDGNSRSYLMRRPEEHHHHLVCSGCGRVVDFSDCDLKGLEANLSHRTGFVIETHYLEFQGRCPECRTNVQAAPL